MAAKARHLPVLADEVLRVLSPRPRQVIVDCTLGLGGHSAAMLERLLPKGHLIAIDFDPHSIAIARSHASMPLLNSKTLHDISQ